MSKLVTSGGDRRRAGSPRPMEPETSSDFADLGDLIEIEELDERRELRCDCRCHASAGLTGANKPPAC